MPVRTKRRTIIIVALIIVALLVLIGAIVIWPRDNEPSYQGKSLSQWIDRCDPETPFSQLAKVHPQEVKAVRAIGTNALPFLLKWIRDEPPLSEARQSLYSLLDRLRIPIPEDPASRIERAERGFRMLGPVASPAIPELARLAYASAENGEFGRLVFTLASIGPTALPAIAEAARTTNVLTGDQAISAIKYSMRELGTNAYPVLVDCLDIPNANVALAAANTLAEAGTEPVIVCAKMVSYFQHPNWGERFNALAVVSKYGEQARGIIPEVVAVLADTNSIVREKAESILRKVAPEVLTNAPAP